jgi:predicted protein tyrosine phosphatase
MEVRVLGYVAASLLLEREPNRWHALVILDSTAKPTGFVEAVARSHLFLHFDDVEHPGGGKQAATPRLIEQGLAFARGKDKLLVCCRAGQGRSVALAYLITWQEGGPEEAVQLLNPTRHRPNGLVVETGSHLLDDRKIFDRFEEWRRQHRHINLADYYDEIEKEFEALEAQGARDRITGA